MFKVTDPREMNETFARAFNRRSLDNLLALYEKDAMLRVDGSGATRAGRSEISSELEALLQAPGTMTAKNSFCIINGDLALLRADWSLDDGNINIASGSSAELVRRQQDGHWLYVIDHSVGASLPRVR